VSDERLRECMATSDFPWAVLLRGEGERAVAVGDFRRFAAAHGVEVGESELDAFVVRLGGRRTEVVDAWSAPGRWLRRLAGRRSETTDLYVIPALR
jgi:hypothetical protein